MNYYKRLLSLLFVFVLLFAVFLTPLNVSAIVTGLNVSDTTNKYKLVQFGSFDADTVHDVISTSTNSILIQDKATIRNMENAKSFRMEIKKADGSSLAESRDKWNLKINGVLASFKWGSSLNSLKTEYCKSFNQIILTIIYNDNSSEKYDLRDDEYSFSSGTNTHHISTREFTAQKDVSRLLIDYVYHPYTQMGITGTKYFAWNLALDPFSMDINVESNEEGLLSGILGWVQNIFSSITDGFADVSSWLANGFRDTVNGLSSGFQNTVNGLSSGFQNTVNSLTNGFKNVVTGVTELPNKLWTLISNGLKSLFVPDSEYMFDYKSNWDNLLSDRLGAVYQVCDIAVSSWDSIMSADNTNSINIPSATINVGVPFTFGGYTVQIVPSGFEILVTALKTIISIVCTFLFINGLLKRYDEIMGVEK